MSQRPPPMDAATRRAREKSPVTKTDLTSYLRCPLAFHLVATGALTVPEAIGPSLMSRLAAGVAFEDALLDDEDFLVENDLVTAPNAAARAELLDEGHAVVGGVMCSNAKVGIVGIPDGVIPDGGAMVPVEVKNHRTANRLDRLELAFYWLLLEPQRSGGPHQPRGQLFLPDPVDGERVVDVTLTDEHLSEVRRLLPRVRKARTKRPLTGVCACYVCTVLEADTLTAQMGARSDLSLIYGIGPAMAQRLRQTGVASHRDLLTVDADELVARMAGGKPGLSAAQLAMLIAHAHAYDQQRPIIVGLPDDLPSTHIAMDCEYLVDNGGHVFLVGLALPDGTVHQIWADLDGEEQLVRDVTAFLDAHPALPIVTWNGGGADLPALRAAAARHGTTSPMDGRDHIDAFAWARKHLRLPAPGLDIKTVAAHFTLARTAAEQVDGLGTQGLYWQAVHDPLSSARQRLLEYNADDVTTVTGTVHELRGLISRYALTFE